MGIRLVSLNQILISNLSEIGLINKAGIMNLLLQNYLMILFRKLNRDILKPIAG